MPESGQPPGQGDTRTGLVPAQLCSVSLTFSAGPSKIDLLKLWGGCLPDTMLERWKEHFLLGICDVVPNSLPLQPGLSIEVMHPLQ